jgi:hypothetical protein
MKNIFRILHKNETLKEATQIDCAEVQSAFQDNERKALPQSEIAWRK